MPEPFQDSSSDFAPRSICQLEPTDNVAIALCDLAPGMDICRGVCTTELVPAGHKVSLRTLVAGEAIIKSNVVIGCAAADVAAGSWLHSHNITPAIVDELPVATSAQTKSIDTVDATFRGFRRADGRVGTRNYIAVLVAGNCAATAARQVAQWFDEVRLADYPHVDGVVPMTHEFGCGMEMTGEPMDLLRRTLSGCIRHPNVAASVVIALGCERNNLYGFLEQEGLVPGDTLKTVVLQEVGGTRAAIDAGIAAVQQMLPVANAARRESVSIDHLAIGLQSVLPDGLSAATANAALGEAVDLLVSHGGTAVLSDSTALVRLGAEFRARAVSEDVRAALQERRDWWRRYHHGRDTQIARSGEQDDAQRGLSNGRDKSVATLRMAGNSPIRAAVPYAGPIPTKGLVFMDAPSYEAVSATGQVAAGVNLVCLASGAGSCFSAPLAPTVKLSSNTATFLRLQDDMDMDCGSIARGERTAAEMGRAIFEHWLRIASGEKTRGELLGVGDEEFAPWPIGVLA